MIQNNNQIKDNSQSLQMAVSGSVFCVDDFLNLILKKIDDANKVIKNNHPRKGFWISPSYCDKAYYKRRKDLGYTDLPYCSTFGNYVYLIYCVSKRIAIIDVSENRDDFSFNIKTDFTKQEYSFKFTTNPTNLIIDNLEKILIDEVEIRLSRN